MSEAASIMMVEDDEGHARLIQKNIRRAGVTIPIEHFRDGGSALGHLFGEEGGSTPRLNKPSLMLLDLNLPDMTGIEILRRVKQNQSWKLLPVIILTTTDDKLEIQKCYDLGCNVYMTKPLGYQRFAESIQHLGLFISVLQVPEAAPQRAMDG